MRAHSNSSLSHQAVTCGSQRKRTLFVVCCSSAKTRSHARHDGPTILESLPTEIGADLAIARDRVAPLARVDESFTLPAWRRYSGGFYRAAAPALQNAVEAGAHVLIVSGGYGVVLADEPIGYYNREYRPGDWPDRIVQRVVAAYAERWGLASVVAIAGHSTLYAKAIRRVRWPAVAEEAVLISPAHLGGGAQARVPPAAGEAFRAVWEGGIPAGWRSTTGTPVRVEQLR